MSSFCAKTPTAGSRSPPPARSRCRAKPRASSIGTRKSWSWSMPPRSTPRFATSRRRCKVCRPDINWVREDDSPMDEETFAFGSFRLIPMQRLLLDGGTPLRLGSRAFDILVALVERAGETIPRDQLIARTWPDTVVEEGALRVHVAALRKALGDGRAGRRYVTNNPGRGYAFVAPVTCEHTPPATARPTGAAAGDNLPAPLTRIVGRDEVIAALAMQLARRRFLTIVGAGGIGKTTVAVAVASAVRASYKDGAWFVGLASLSDPDLVPSAVGAALGMPPSGANPVQGLTAWLRD